MGGPEEVFGVGVYSCEREWFVCASGWPHSPPYQSLSWWPSPGDGLQDAAVLVGVSSWSLGTASSVPCACFGVPRGMSPLLGCLALPPSSECLERSWGVKVYTFCFSFPNWSPNMPHVNATHSFKRKEDSHFFTLGHRVDVLLGSSVLYTI